MGRKKQDQADEVPVAEAEAEPSFAEVWESYAPGCRISKGVYSLYKTAEGGLHISYRPEDATEDQHLPIPAPMVAMMLAASEGKGPLGRVKALVGARLGG